MNYAAAIAFEVRSPTDGGEPTIRLQFKNGSEEATFTEYEFMGAKDVPMSTFVQRLAVSLPAIIFCPNTRLISNLTAGLYQRHHSLVQCL